MIKIKIILILSLFLVKSALFAQKGQFSIGFMAGSLFYEFDNTRYVSFSQNFNYTVGLYIKKNISFKQNIVSIKTGYFIDTKCYDIAFSDTLLYNSKNKNDSFVYGNIPLIIDYSYAINDRYYPFISAGFIFGHILKEVRQTMKNDGTVENGFPFDSENLQNPIDFYVSIGLNYGISKQFLLRFEPYLTYQINNGGYNNQDVNGMLAYGFKLGVQFDFIFQKHKGK
ncbi:MAG: PorT family protein [Chlorobi bacterium]|nr:PorT family protein [Chlorobiota bacterium]